MLQCTALQPQTAAIKALARLELCPCQTQLAGSQCHYTGTHNAGFNNLKSYGADSMNRFSIANATLLALGFALVTPGQAQEVANPDQWSPSREAKIAPVTQDQLNAADKNATNFLLTNGN